MHLVQCPLSAELRPRPEGNAIVCTCLRSAGGSLPPLLRQQSRPPRATAYVQAKRPLNHRITCAIGDLTSTKRKNEQAGTITSSPLRTRLLRVESTPPKVSLRSGF